MPTMDTSSAYNGLREQGLTRLHLERYAASSAYRSLKAKRGAIRKQCLSEPAAIGMIVQAKK